MFSWVLLRQSSKSQTVEVFKLNAGINNIGRKKNNNIVVSSKYTSGSHCEIFVSDERIELTDRSTFGTFVNSYKVHQTTKPLFDGCLIGLGCCVDVRYLPDYDDTCYVYLLQKITSRKRRNISSNLHSDNWTIQSDQDSNTNIVRLKRKRAGELTPPESPSQLSTPPSFREFESYLPTPSPQSMTPPIENVTTNIASMQLNANPTDFSPASPPAEPEPSPVLQNATPKCTLFSPPRMSGKSSLDISEPSTSPKIPSRSMTSKPSSFHSDVLEKSTVAGRSSKSTLFSPPRKTGKYSLDVSEQPSTSKIPPRFTTSKSSSFHSEKLAKSTVAERTSNISVPLKPSRNETHDLKMNFIYDIISGWNAQATGCLSFGSTQNDYKWTIMKTLKEYTWSAYQHALAHLMEPFEAQVRYVGKDVMQNIEIKSIFCDVNKKCGIVADELVIIFVDGKKYFSYVKAVADPAGSSSLGLTLWAGPSVPTPGKLVMIQKVVNMAWQLSVIRGLTYVHSSRALYAAFDKGQIPQTQDMDLIKCPIRRKLTKAQFGVIGKLYSECLHAIPTVSLVNGGAGTGKTSILLQLAITLATKNKKRILIVSADEKTSDNHATGLFVIRKNIDENDIRSMIIVCRYGNPQHQNSPNSIARNQCEGNGKLERDLYVGMVKSSNIVCTTFESLVKMYKYVQKFDVCIFDDATQSTELNNLAAFQYEFNSVLFFGDDKMSPTNKESVTDQSYFSRMYRYTYTLVERFRMPRSNLYDALGYQSCATMFKRPNSGHTLREFGLFNIKDFGESVMYALFDFLRVIHPLAGTRKILVVVPDFFKNGVLSMLMSDKYAAMGASVATPHTLLGEWDIVLMLNPSELHEVHTLRYCLTRAIHSLIILDTFASKPDEKNLAVHNIWNKLNRNIVHLHPQSELKEYFN